MTFLNVFMNNFCEIDAFFSVDHRILRVISFRLMGSIQVFELNMKYPLFVLIAVRGKSLIT